MVRPKRHSRPGYVSPGESTHNRPSSHKGALARGMTRPGKALTSAPPEVLCPRGTQGFGNLPKDRRGLGRGETTYTTSESSLCTNGVLLPNTQVGWVSLLTQEVLSPHSGLCRILGGLWRQAAQSTKNTNNSFIFFPDMKITLIWDAIIYISGCIHRTYISHSPISGQYHKHFFLTHIWVLLSLSARDKLTLSPVSPLGPLLVVAGTCNDTRLPRQLESTYCGPWLVTIYTPATL